MQIAEYLADQHIAFEKLMHPPAYTAQKRAKYLGVPGRLVAKAVLMRGPNGFFLAVLPGPKHIDTSALARELGSPVSLATRDEVAEVFRDCEWGVVGPFGVLYGLEDRAPRRFASNHDDWLIFESNSHAEAVAKILCRDYEKLERPLRL